MPAKRKTSKKTVVKKPQVYSSNGASYDTMMIITILLLIFVYPLGIIFMWGFMKTWPTWLKVVIMLPLIISVSVMLIVFYFIGQAVRHVDWNTMYRNQQRYERMQQRYQQMMQLTPTPTTQYTY